MNTKIRSTNRLAELKPDNGQPAMVEAECNVPRMDIRIMQLTVIGVTPLVCHAWSEKAMKEIESKQGGVATDRRKPKNPKQEFQSARYLDSDGDDCIPAIAFKKAAVDACRNVENISMVQARTAFFVKGDLIKIVGSKPIMRTDMVRIPSGADIRYRPEYKTWKCKITIEYDASVITEATIVHLFQKAGWGVGIGENRPQKTGNNWGTWRVATTSDKAD